ncbi:PREDICTED: uncharacterized protein LOC106295833 [Brassica oleracea var. oleracea]|uniref:uncharacterized protein LOC106295833 n=1 Tax=Brassica oleracea var. oleracea TaxID=109376 RepID=UPI0006A6CB9E|nr:PREDICTED: uncharacterized protein LOC106295833 [Brassica oleracea var. oleracea]
MSSGVYYRSWMDKLHMDPNTNLLTEEYVQGIGEFMKLVEQQPVAKTGMLRCLCSICNNNRIIREFVVWTHLYMRGFSRNYKVWYLHGETGYEYGSSSASSSRHGPRKHAIPHPVVLHPVAAEVVRRAVPVHRDHLTNKTRFPHMFPLPLHMFPLQLLRRIRGSCQFNNWFNNQIESISRFSNPTHDRDIQLGSTIRAMALAGASTI